MDAITQNALDHVRRNGARYRRDFFGPGPYPLKIQAIKQLRSETNAGLLEAKNAIEAWEAEGKPTVVMSNGEAKILLKNLLLRGGQSGLTPLEVEAIRRLAE